jgi:hypothetical protein
LLNKLVLEFDDVFWGSGDHDADADMFGCLREDPAQKGQFCR